jgi:hypothetical protein
MQAGEIVDPALPVDWDHRLNRGRVAWYYTPAGVQPGGTKVRNLCGRAHGTLTNVTPGLTSGWTGMFGGASAIYYDGTNDYTAITPSADWPDIGGAKTIAFWAKWDGDVSGSGPGRKILFTMVLNDSSSANNGHSIEFNVLGGFACVNSVEWGGGSKGESYLIDVGIVAGQWFHVLYRCDAGWTNQEIWLNNTLPTMQNLATSTQAGAPGVARIGSYNAAFPDPYANRPIGDVSVWNRRLTDDERKLNWSLTRQGYRLPESPLRWIRPWAAKGPSGGGGGVTCTPGVASLSLTRFAPTVQTPRLVTPGVRSLSTTGLAPSVVVGKIATPGVRSLSLSPFAPVISTPRLVTPGKLSLTLTVYAPTAAAPRLVTPGKLSLTTTSYAPAISTPRTVTPGTAALVITRYVPGVGSPKQAIPATASLTITSFSPVARAPRTATPGTAGLSLTKYAPTVQTPRLATPATRAITLTSFAPTIAAGASVRVTPGTAALVITLYAPTVTAVAAADPLILEHTFSFADRAREESFSLAGRTLALAMAGRDHTYQMSR